MGKPSPTREVTVVLVVDVMTAPAVSIRPEESLEAAIIHLGRSGITALPVVDCAHHVVGILSEADVLRQSLPADPRAHLRPGAIVSPQDRTVAEVMTTDAVCTSPNSDCADVARILTNSGWKSMPVVSDDGRLLGMVSRSDLVRSMTRPDGVIRESVLIAFDAAGHPEWGAHVHDGHVTVDTLGDGLGPAALAVASTVAGARSVQLAEGA